LGALELLKELCEDPCYRELEECEYLEELEAEPHPHLARKAVVELLHSAAERGCDPSRALGLLIKLFEGGVGEGPWRS